jgi:hypothetical protein
VIDKIGRLGGCARRVFVGAGNRELRGLLAELLEPQIPVGEELARPARRGARSARSLGDRRVERA